MLFNSTAFLTLLAFVVGVYYFFGRRGQNGLLLLASYVFYGWWDWRFCSLLLFSSVLDYVAADKIKKVRAKKRKKEWLYFSLAGNLGVLGLFKYFDFFSQSLQDLLGIYGVQADWPTLHIILPIGISFYTFQSMAYTIDVYRGKLRPIKNFLNFALYVSFFPQLVAGPIERADHLLPQLNRKREADFNRICEGLLLMLIGFVRKIAIADYLAPIVDQTFSNFQTQSSGVLVAGLLMFSLQIYADFAGYSDIARGSAKILGIDLRVNFDQPYFSKSFSEFWRRWHISLSSWLRDYLYIPLGGNQGSVKSTGRNLMLTMLLGGLWHGASWTFVVWGGLHGVYLALERIYFKKRLSIAGCISCYDAYLGFLSLGVFIRGVFLPDTNDFT